MTTRVPESTSRTTALNSTSPTASQAHRPHEVGRIGGGERLVDEPGRLPVGLQGDLHLFEHSAFTHQSAAHHYPFFSRVVNCGGGADFPRLAADREEDVPDGLTGSHPDGNPILPPMITCY